MRQHRAGTLNTWVVVLSMVVLVGCSSTTASVPMPSPTPTPKSASLGPRGTPTPTYPPFTLPPTLSMQAAWGKVVIRNYTTDVGNGWDFQGMENITPDGRYLVGTTQQLTNARTEPWYVALYDLQTRQVTRIHQAPGLHATGSTTVGDTDWIVWMEATDGGMFDWRIYAYNRHTGKIQQLAEATKLNGTPVVGPPPAPYVDHGLVVWGQALSPNRLDYVAILYNLATGEKTTLATNAGSPQITWPWIMWDQATDSGGYEQFRNLQTGQEVRLNAIAIHLAISGNAVAYVTPDYGMVKYLPDITRDTTHPTIIDEADPNNGSGVEFVTMTDRLISWNRDNGFSALVYDRLLKIYVEVPIPASGRRGGMTTGGPYLVWVDAVTLEQNQVDSNLHRGSIHPFHIVDLRTLPTVSP